MKNLIEKLVGGKVYATASNINGRKSSGCEDLYGYQNWRKHDDNAYEATQEAIR